MSTLPAVFRSVLGLMLASALLASAGCVSSATDTDRGSRHTLTAFANSEWSLVRWVPADGSPATLPDARPTVRIGYAGRIDGNSGVNRYSTTVEVHNGSLRWGETAGTRMAGDPGLMEMEARFLSDLRASTRVTVRGDRLVFEGERPLRLEFSRVGR